MVLFPHHHLKNPQDIRTVLKVMNSLMLQPTCCSCFAHADWWSSPYLSANGEPGPARGKTYGSGVPDPLPMLGGCSRCGCAGESDETLALMFWTRGLDISIIEQILQEAI